MKISKKKCLGSFELSSAQQKFDVCLRLSKQLFTLNDLLSVIDLGGDNYWDF